MYPWWGIMSMFYPMLPNDCNKPPTIYSLLESIVNFENDTPVKTSELAKNGRDKIFDFDYPLTEHITKEDFEVMILNNYMMRRIGYETPTAFKIALDVKLNSIMPIYNKMFDSLENWSLFNDGENIIRTVTRGENSTTTSNSTTRDDSRYSDTPQGRLNDIEAGTYMTDYTLNQNTSNSTDTNNKNGNETENITRTPGEKLELYKEFQNNIKSIYELIFDELDDLFYSLN